MELKVAGNDLEAATALMHVLESVVSGYHPNVLADNRKQTDPMFFDPDDKDHLSALYKAIEDCMTDAPGFLSRAVIAMHRLTNETCRCHEVVVAAEPERM